MGERDGGLIADLDRLLNRGVDPERDGDLLARFRANGDHDAFTTLVMRHGPMVRGVCRRLLRDANDADDAFQATFLVLARKGGGLRDSDRLGPWLYGVASRVAAKARSRSARRKDRPLTEDLPARDDPPAEWSDVLPILDAELARLPSKQREVLVACLLGGASEQEAARSFGCPVGTVKSRLSRGRETLRARLVRRGIAPATALAAASIVESSASFVSAPLLRATLSLVAAPASIPRSVATLTSGVAPTMLSRIFVPATVVAGGLAVLGLSATAWTGDPPPDQPATAPAAKSPPETRAQLDRNLRSILLALHNYVSANGWFPPPATHSPDGQPLLSWRVALLPYLDQKELFDRFHLDEPWDSPQNKELIALMPSVFQTPGYPASSGRTRIRGVDARGAMFDSSPIDLGKSAGAGMGPGMMMMEPGMDDMAIGRAMGPGMVGGTPGMRKGVDRRAMERAQEANAKPPAKGQQVTEPVDRGPGLHDITDGTSNTVFLMVAEDPVEWTRPGELEIPGGLKTGATLPAIIEDDDGYIMAMVDGSVRRLPRQPGRREILLPAMLTLAGGEVISPVSSSSDVFAPASLKPSAEPVAEKAPPAFERRLRRVEEKLDEILDRLDGLAAPKR